MGSQFVPGPTENKLILLFVLDKMEIPLTENSVIDITTSRNNWLTYMDCKDVLWQLIESKFIYFEQNPNYKDEGNYSITSEGRECLAHFFAKIPQSIRENISVFCKKNRMSFKRAQEYIGVYHKNNDGSHTIVLRINNPQDFQPLLKIQLKVDSRRSAISACKKWQEKAPLMYESILENLLD